MTKKQAEREAEKLMKLIARFEDLQHSHSFRVAVEEARISHELNNWKSRALDFVRKIEGCGK